MCLTGGQRIYCADNSRCFSYCSANIEFCFRVGTAENAFVGDHGIRHFRITIIRIRRSKEFFCTREVEYKIIQRCKVDELHVHGMLCAIAGHAYFVPYARKPEAGAEQLNDTPV